MGIGIVFKPSAQNVGMNIVFLCKDKGDNPLGKSRLKILRDILHYPTVYPTRKKFDNKKNEENPFTCTMAMCRRTPRSPTVNEAAAMTAGPVMNRTAMAKVATEFPHAIILGCNAMNRPVIHEKDVVSETQP